MISTLFGTRYYDPTTGRWTQQDPNAGSIGNPQTVDRYTYAGDDPIDNVDPAGLSSCGFSLGGLVDCASKVGGAVNSVASPVANAWNTISGYVQACGAGGEAGAYVGTAAAVLSSGGLDAEITVPLGYAAGCIAAVDYRYIVTNS